ncbi:MAG: hypothetical protein JRH18_25605, partial [Deltaproteobacteria bacterium]|nr:hypothetical protein [Deltaproteobacteria bacterium]
MFTIGIDIGTTNIKGIVINPEGKKIAYVSRPTRIHYKGTEIADFYPDEIWQDIKTIISQLCSVLIDKKGKPMAPSIAWFDHRSNEIMEAWKKEVDEYEIFQITGLRIGGVSSLAKILWEKRNLLKIYQTAEKWLFIPSYIINKLTGKYITDYSMASRSMLFDIHKRVWSEKICRLADVRLDLLPKAEPSATPVGEIPRRLASSLGLPGHVVVVLGGHDHPCGAFSTGLRRKGDIVNSIGTVDVLYSIIDPAMIDQGFFDAAVSCGCHVVEGQTYLIGGTLTAGIMVDWFIDNFYKHMETEKEKIYDLLVKDACNSPAGSNGVVVLPHLRGSYTPHKDPMSKGAILGLRTTHTYKDIIRAMFEGLALEFRVILDKYIEL